MNFTSSEEMLKTIQKGVDLYNPVSEEYVFAFADENGAICVYQLSNEEADKLVNESSDGYWSVLLGAGGKIYDAPENVTWCNERFSMDGWTDTTDMHDPDGKPRFTFASLKSDLAEKKEVEKNVPVRAEKHMNRGGIEL